MKEKKGEELKGKRIKEGRRGGNSPNRCLVENIGLLHC